MKIKGYKLEKQIGSGGMAMVYLAIQESLGRPVALKILNPLFSGTPEFSERFLDEGRILASLNHSNIITIHDIGISGNYHFISMEYVEGGDLKAKIRQGIDPDTATSHIETIASCLGVAHKAHIVHRDVKPVNILFRKDGTLLLTDFGIAKMLSANKELTATGSMLGSPHYLSPEQAEATVVDGRADIYSLGIIYYEMLTGKKPITGETDITIAIKHLTEPMPRLPEELAAYQSIIDKMTQKKPDDRFPDTDSLIAAIHELRTTGYWSGEINANPSPADITPVSMNAAKAGASAPGKAKDQDADHEETQVINDLTFETDVAANRSSRLKWAVAGAAVLLVALLAIMMLSGRETTTDSTDTIAEADTTEPAISKSGAEVATAAPAGDAAVERKVVSDTPENEGLLSSLPWKQKAAEAEKARLAEQQRQTKIVSLLDKAETALAENHLTTPAQTSAYAYYQQVLAIDPGNVVAQEGLNTIANRYYVLARDSAEKWNYEGAMVYVERGLGINGEHEQLLALKQDLQKEDGKSGRKFKQAFKGVKGWFD